MHSALFSGLKRFCKGTSTTIMNRTRNGFYFVVFLSLFCMYLVWSTSVNQFIKEYTAYPENDSMLICNTNLADKRKHLSDINLGKRRRSVQTTTTAAGSGDEPPIIYFVTPTYPRREQIAELTRLGQTLMHVPHLHWIVADDSDVCNVFLDHLLNRFGIPYTHLASPMPDYYRTIKGPAPRGVANRRAALKWLLSTNRKSGVLYFGDDDNTYDLRLFSEIRYTKHISMFPVGLIGNTAVSSPVVKNGKVIGFFDPWPSKRLWPVDMAGFAVNLDVIVQNPNVTMPYKAGLEEDGFLRSLDFKLEQIEPLANNCTEILVWHTQTKNAKIPTIKISTSILETDKTSLGMLLRELELMGVSRTSQTTGVKATMTKDSNTQSLSSWF